MAGTKYLGIGLSVPISNTSGFEALTSPDTQLYPFAQNHSTSPGKELRKLTNSKLTNSQTYTTVLEWATGPTGSGSPATLLNIPAGQAGVVEKIKFVSGSN